MHFAGDQRFVVFKGVAEKSPNRLLLLLILKSSKFPRKPPVLESILVKLQACMPATFLKRDSKTGIFPVKFAKFLRAPVLKYICEPLLLYLQVILVTIHEKDTANEA